MRLSAVPLTDDACGDLPGPVLFVTGALVIGLHGVSTGGDAPRLLPITPATRALVEERRGSVICFVGGWVLSLTGACLAWLAPQGHLGMGLGVAAMFAGSWLVHCCLEGCTTHLLLGDGDRVCELACRVRPLGEDADALHDAQRAVLHAATLLDARLARRELAAAQDRRAWPAAQIQALLQPLPERQRAMLADDEPLP